MWPCYNQGIILYTLFFLGWHLHCSFPWSSHNEPFPSQSILQCYGTHQLLVILILPKPDSCPIRLFLLSLIVCFILIFQTISGTYFQSTSSSGPSYFFWLSVSQCSLSIIFICSKRSLYLIIKPPNIFLIFIYLFLSKSYTDHIWFINYLFFPFEILAA